jgi:hypothetical protein
MDSAPPADKLETALARIFALCDANRAALLKARENAKLSRRRYWWQDTENENTKTKHQNQTLNNETPTNHARPLCPQSRPKH